LRGEGGREGGREEERGMIIIAQMVLTT